MPVLTVSKPNNLNCPEDAKPEEIMLSYIDYSCSNHNEQFNTEME